MIDINDIAEMIETGLNQRNGESGISYRIWGSAGENQPLERVGNTLTEYIYGTLVRTSSANDASTIAMGANTLVLDLYVPIKNPMTYPSGLPTPRIVEGQYPFLDTVLKTVDGYFTLARSFQYTSIDTLGVSRSYSVGMNAEVSTTGTVDLLPIVGNGVLISVGIELLFVEDGVNARDVTITIDGNRTTVPYQSVQFGDSAMRSSDVRSGDKRSRSYDSATSVAFSITFPATDQAFTQTLLEYIFDPVPNQAHFVTIEVGDETYSYFMLLDAPNASAQQVANIGLTVGFVEVIGDVEIMNVPSTYRVGRFTLASSSVNGISFSISKCTFYIAGNVYISSGAQTISIEPEDIIYDEEEDEYYVYLIADNSRVTVTGGIEWV